MEGSRRTARRDLAEDAVSQTQFTFDHEVEQIVRHSIVIAWRRIHFKRAISRSENCDRIAGCGTSMAKIREAKA
jgi:hypothetical protein